MWIITKAYILLLYSVSSRCCHAHMSPCSYHFWALSDLLLISSSFYRRAFISHQSLSHPMQLSSKGITWGELTYSGKWDQWQELMDNISSLGWDTYRHMFYTYSQNFPGPSVVAGLITPHLLVSYLPCLVSPPYSHSNVFFISLIKYECSNLCLKVHSCENPK